MALLAMAVRGLTSKVQFRHAPDFCSMNDSMADDRNKDASFYPSGAIAFFAAMTAFFAAVWLALYALMIHRH